VLVLPQPVIDLDQEAIKVFTIAEFSGMIARFLMEFHLICSPASLRFSPAGLIYCLQQRPTRDETRGVPQCPPC
jgi:hypothetical protein